MTLALTHDTEEVSPAGVGALPVAHFVAMGSRCGDDSVTKALVDAYGGIATRTLSAPSANAIVAERGAMRLLSHSTADGGWIVVKGMVHDTRTGRTADVAAVTEAFFDDTPDFNRFEGEFAAVIHDSRRDVTWALNDHASLIHLYYVERAGVLYVTTAPLPTAKAIGLGLSGPGVREFLGRGQVMCPNSLYGGMRRLGLGEHLRWKSGQLQVERHWSPYRQEQRYTSKRTAAEVTAEVLIDAANRYSRRGPIVADLTGGYDSRLLASALSKAGASVTVTVNGHERHPEVVVARRVAHAAGWPMIHFGQTFPGEMSGEVRRAAAYMSRGELSAAQFYLHIITRPILGKNHVAHLQGGGGELLRSFPWGQEFTGIGRHRSANVDRVLRYRMLVGSELSETLFRTSFRNTLREELRSRVQAVIDDGAGTRTTQQLDAIFLLKLTGHFGGYTSSLFDLLPTGVPLLHRTFIDHGISLPWTMRLTAGLLRRTSAMLHPRAASIETLYGSTAAPVTFKTLPLEVRQLWRASRHFANKIDRVMLGGRISRFVPLGTVQAVALDPPFRTEEFRTFLNPSRLYSRGLYDQQALRHLTSDPFARSESLSRIATLEHVCRELGIEPGPEVLLA